MEKWKKETAKSAVPIILVWAATGTFLYFAFKVYNKPPSPP
ncbi:MAG: hypothetical protein PHE15_05605 [Dehalococcoidales bacterium]|nr:hypothetical protein [Dehalococcoidales bacterium]